MTPFPPSLAGPAPQLPTPRPKMSWGNHTECSPVGAAHPGHLRGPRLTFTPKSGDVELQMAPTLVAASMASTACALLGK